MKKNSVKREKLKIAFVSDAIYPYNKGGKEKRLFEISTKLANSGYDVHIYCMKWWNAKENERIENGVTLHAISKLYPLYSGKRRSISQAFFFAISCFKLLKEDFDVLDVDHMPHLVLFSTKIVALLKRKRFIATWNEVWGRKYWNEYLGKLGNIAFIIEWLSARMPDEIIAISEHTKNKLIQELKVKQKIYVVPNGINFNEIQKNKSAKEKSDVIFVGRLLSNKNVDILLKAIAQIKMSLPHVAAIIIGNGPEKNALQKMVKEMRLEKNVKMIGFLENHNDVYSLMKASKVFVFPSTREGFGIAALEANAAGIPVITTNHKNNATKDLILPGVNGLAIELTEEKLAKAIKRLLFSKNYSSKYKNVARSFDWSNMAKKVEEIHIA